MDRSDHIWDGVRLTYLLRYLPPRYNNELSMLKAYIQKQADDSRHLKGYNVGKKETNAFFDKRRADNLGNLCQSSFSTIRSPIFWRNNGGKWVYDLDGWWRCVLYLKIYVKVLSWSRSFLYEIACPIFES